MAGRPEPVRVAEGEGRQGRHQEGEKGQGREARRRGCRSGGCGSGSSGSGSGGGKESGEKSRKEVVTRCLAAALGAARGHRRNAISPGVLLVPKLPLGNAGLEALLRVGVWTRSGASRPAFPSRSLGTRVLPVPRNTFAGHRG